LTFGFREVLMCAEFLLRASGGTYTT